MLTVTQRSISSGVFISFFLLFVSSNYYSFIVIIVIIVIAFVPSFFLAIATHMCPSFCPTKTTKHFSPLSCSCTLVPYDDGLTDSFSPLLCHEKFFFLFLFKKKYCLFIFLNSHLYVLSSTCTLLLKKKKKPKQPLF